MAGSAVHAATRSTLLPPNRRRPVPRSCSNADRLDRAGSKQVRSEHRRLEGQSQEVGRQRRARMRHVDGDHDAPVAGASFRAEPISTRARHHASSNGNGSE